MIPKDIILCPWHYERREAFPSLPMFIKKGFGVLPASWKKVDASGALIRYSLKQKSPKMLDHLFTTWGAAKDTLLTYRPMVEGLKLLQSSRK
jgi:hypothetical protein